MLRHVLNSIEHSLNGLKMAKFAKLRQIADEYLDIICAIFLAWQQFISFFSPFLK